MYNNASLLRKVFTEEVSDDSEKKGIVVKEPFRQRHIIMLVNIIT